MWCILIIVLVVWVIVTAFGANDMLLPRLPGGHIDLPIRGKMLLIVSRVGTSTR
jgi:hypothetical protein